MILGELLDRCYAILGDSRENPRWFERASLVKLLNNATTRFRGEVEDEWYSKEIPTVASQAVYDFPAGHLKPKRIAYGALTLEPMASIGALAGRSEAWDTLVSETPTGWTSDGLPYNEFRLLPIPTLTSATYVALDLEYGTIVDLTVGGIAAGFDYEYGILLNSGTELTDSEHGVLVDLTIPGGDTVTVWGVPTPPAMESDDDMVPIKQAFYLALVWYACWQTYEQGKERHNSVLAGFYKTLWDRVIARAQALSDNPFPRMVNVMGAAAEAQVSDPAPFSQSVMVSGSPITVRWGRRH